MRGHALSQGQLRGRLGHVFDEFQAHGKVLDKAELKKFIEDRIENGLPNLGEMFKDFEERDYASFLLLLKFDESVSSGEYAKEQEKIAKLEAATEKVKVTKGKKKKSKKGTPKEELSDVEIDPLDV